MAADRLVSIDPETGTLTRYLTNGKDIWPTHGVRLGEPVHSKETVARFLEHPPADFAISNGHKRIKDAGNLFHDSAIKLVPNPVSYTVPSEFVL